MKDLLNSHSLILYDITIIGLKLRVTGSTSTTIFGAQQPSRTDLCAASTSSITSRQPQFLRFKDYNCYNLEDLLKMSTETLGKGIKRMTKTKL
ncbi:hypothetical protein D8674_004344 [Pyrus ussuriensis x Pyrus communis]|uniref:Uncharacterized protein n=1 Tax=Pyrus ussuriensis x Pyrus communis TaxID=2448454 RepID=A0A5N5FJL6_9ROSA|nr:hypothetical protein D8674_004344 [Pyrus ussuriensis x Pyrus communis]